MQPSTFSSFSDYTLDYVEIYSPMAKSLAYWHTHALGFSVVAYAGAETGKLGLSSYVLASGDIRLVITSSYPTATAADHPEVRSFIAQNYCGVKRFALRVASVKEAFEQSLAQGALPVRFPTVTEDEQGHLEEAAIKLYDHNEITFINREAYNGVFKPGYKAQPTGGETRSFFTAVDHIASELRINESQQWTNYLTDVLGTSMVQSIPKSAENQTGLLLKVSQSANKKLTLVIAEPESYQQKSKVQHNIDTFGPGIHHLAFTTDDLVATLKEFTERGVEFVRFPAAYYDLLRSNEDFAHMDIDTLEQWGILVDKEDDTYLLQKFIKPISDRPFFFYEVVQRVNGYNGFALKNINVLKKAEELDIMRTNA